MEPITHYQTSDIMNNIDKPKNSIKIIIIFVLTLILSTGWFSGCIEETNSNLTTVDVPLNQIALHEDEVNFTSLQYSNYTTDPYIIENLTGNDLSWNISENYINLFVTNSSKGMQEVLFKFPTIKEAKRYLMLIKPYLINQTKSTEESISLIGDETFVLSREITIENKSINHWAIYLRMKNVIVIISGPSENLSSLTPYAELIEEKIHNTLK